MRYKINMQSEADVTIDLTGWSNVSLTLTLTGWSNVFIRAVQLPHAVLLKVPIRSYGNYKSSRS